MLHNISKLLLALFIVSCQEPIPDPIPTTTLVRAKSKLSNVRIPEGFDCGPDREIARNLASRCWEEQAGGCVRGSERRKGECPVCDALERKQEAMLKDGCIRTQEEFDKENTN